MERGLGVVAVRGLVTRFQPSPRELSQSGPLARAFSRLLALLPPPPRELVFHSLKWATGSHIFQAFGPVAAFFQAASGPLSKVDHWLAPFRAFDPVSAFFLGS